MIKYKFYEKKYKHNQKEDGFLIIDLEKKYSMVAMFLLSDAEMDFEAYKKMLKEILNSDEDQVEIAGETCLLEMRKKYTIITNHLIPEEDWDEMEKEIGKENLEGKIATEDLLKLLLVWEKAYKAFMKDRTILEGGIIE